MQCPRCQAQNEEGARFCEDCGARLELACPTCGAPVGMGKKFCRSCGASVTTEPRRVPSPQAYTPKHLAEKILTSKSALEGERKQVTVLFADLKGSMELLADRDPEEARKLLDPVLERMMEAVHRYEGTVNQVMGDGIMALFGAPLAHEDHAVRACYAALDLQAAMRRYTDEVRRSHGIAVQVRIGLNSGEVVVRAIGSDLHMDYTAVGQSTHLAARMEQLATPGSTLLTAGTLRLAEGYVAVKSLGPVPVKGLEASVEVFEMLGAGPRRSRLHAAAARGLSRFVGRESELEQLRQALGRAAAGHGQLVAIVGEPGVGKSRLVWEVTHSHRTHGWLILESSSVSYGRAASYLPVIDLLKTYCQVEARDEARTVREKVMGKLLALDRALEPTLPAFLTLLDVPIEDPQWQALDPPQRRQRTLDALKRLLLRESQVQPLLLVFEDLHWIDTETQALLDRLVESLPTARVLLVVNYRPEYQHGWGGKTFYTQLRLDPLPPESAQELLEALLGTDAGLQPLKQLLIARTEGNPFFLEESVRSLVETRMLSGERGNYRPAKELPAIEVPATVQAILAARIDRLPPEEKRLLQAASVIGKDVPLPILQAISEFPEEALRQGLTHLQSAEFLYETSLFPDLEYTFKHALTHEVAYGSLLQERRRALHGRIVEAIERLYPDRIGEQAETLAHHAARGEAWEKAVGYCRQAGLRSTARSAVREAAAYFERALEALRRVPEHRETLELGIDLRLDLWVVFMLLADHARALDSLRQAEALAGAIEDQRRLGAAYSGLSAHFRRVGDLDQAIVYAQRAQVIADASGDFPLQVQTAVRLGMAYQALGDYRQATDLLRQTVQALEGDLIHHSYDLPIPATILSRTYLVWSLAEQGEFGEGITRANEGLRIAETISQPRGLAAACFGLGVLSLLRGDLQKAMTALERSLTISQAHDIRVWLATTASRLGHAYALAGRIAEALPLLEQAAGQAASSGGGGHSPMVRYLGEAYLLAGRLQEAMEQAQHALDLARKRKERGYQAWALCLLGNVAAHPDPPDTQRADDWYRQALTLAGELGMRPLQAHCHLGLGSLYRRTGRLEPARSELVAGIELFRAMEMIFWLPRAESELAKTA